MKLKFVLGVLMKKLSICILICILLASNVFALEGVPKDIKNIHEFGWWVRYNFKYIYEYGKTDYWQGYKETIEKKGGDCEDFAILYSAYLSEQKVDNWIMFITFKKLDVGHAICVWKIGEDWYMGEERVRGNTLFEQWWYAFWERWWPS